MNIFRAVFTPNLVSQVTVNLLTLALLRHRGQQTGIRHFLFFMSLSDVMVAASNARGVKQPSHTQVYYIYTVVDGYVCLYDVRTLPP